MTKGEEPMVRYTNETCKLLSKLIEDLDQTFGNVRPTGFKRASLFDAYHHVRQEMKREEREWKMPKAMRERHGLSIEDCARANGVSPGTWAKWENGEVKKMRPIAEKVTPMVEKAARHFFDGATQIDLEDAIDAVETAH